ncbi:MAG TPA: decarboxylating 6-phosphogluconate dehydrogenase [Patescibacteria group bacterium]|nr:decarboxylating 6-phosphogluconate dehydrogenase [Patescibacteria group bacterium]
MHENLLRVPPNKNMEIGFVGLGKMGKGVVLHLLEKKIKVVVWNRSKDDVDEVVKFGATPAKDHKDLISKLDSPRVIWIMVPQGKPVDEMIDKLIPHVNKKDLIIDGGNSFYKDTVKRGKKLKGKVHFMDIGTSGGPKGARNGACLMVGGTMKDYKRIEKVLKIVAAPKALGLFGKLGAGHFAKMVHNGIEYGMMQAIAEGAGVLKKSNLNLDLAEIFRVYNNKSVIESRLVGWTEESFKEDPNLKAISSKIDSTGEGEWTINAAHELGIKVPVIEKSFEVRQKSSVESEDFRDKVVSALRGKFGGHQVSKT